MKDNVKTENAEIKIIKQEIFKLLENRRKEKVIDREYRMIPIVTTSHIAKEGKASHRGEFTTHNISVGIVKERKRNYKLFLWNGLNELQIILWNELNELQT